MSQVRQEVEAALLNSEDDPEQEILAALQGVVRFAKLECETTDQGLRDLLEQAFKVEV
jgi:hypothetical protein